MVGALAPRPRFHLALPQHSHGCGSTHSDPEPEGVLLATSTGCFNSYPIFWGWLWFFQGALLEGSPPLRAQIFQQACKGQGVPGPSSSLPTFSRSGQGRPCWSFLQRLSQTGFLLSANFQKASHRAKTEHFSGGLQEGLRSHQQRKHQMKCICVVRWPSTVRPWQHLTCSHALEESLTPFHHCLHGNSQQTLSPKP